MQRCVQRALVALMLLIGIAPALAQTGWTSTTSARSWNTYVASVIPDRFSSIIGAGGTRLTNSGNVGANTFGEYQYTVPLPMNIIFMNQSYTAGTNVLISTNGYVSFANTHLGSTNGTFRQYHSYYGYYWYGNQSGYGTSSRVIFAFVSSHSTSGLADGGVYTMVTGAAGNRVWTIEWKTQDNYNYYSTAGSFWNFQIMLYEATGNIEYHYGPQDFKRGYYFYNSALVGLKHTGEYYYYSGSAPTATTRNTAESNRYFLFNNPGYGEGDTVAITGQRVYWYGSYGYLEYYPWYYNAGPPNYSGDETRCPYAWHFHFPTDADGARIAYRMSPVLNDVKTDTAWVTPTRPANAYAPGATITINATFSNLGGNSRQNVPVEATIYRNGVKLTSVSATAFPSVTAQFGSHTLAFPTVGSRWTDTTGVFEVRVYPQLTGDQDAGNDTVRVTFYISKDLDATPYAILQPLSNNAPLFQKYPVGVGVPIEIRYMNLGLRTIEDVKVGYYISDNSGNVVHRDSTVLTGLWPAISFRDVTFANWTPTAPGSFYVRAWTSLPFDQQPLNDTLPVSGLGKQFDVRYEIEISAADIGGSGNSPIPNGSFPIGKPIPTLATFLNSGVSDATNIPVRLQIRNSAGAIVYDRTALILDIVADNGRTTQAFPSFTPTTAGTYCVTAFSEYAQEPVRANDTVRWCFNVKPALSGTIRVGFGERFRSVGEARDSVMFYGVAGPVAFELTDDAYTVVTTEITMPALDWRGRIVGLGANTPIVFRPALGKTMVTINLKSASGIGMWFGQLDTSNPSGYISFDGTNRKALTITYENTNNNTSQPAYQRSLPMFYGQGASNYGILNTTIRPANTTSQKKQFLSIPIVRYLQSFNEFQFSQDLNLAVSAGIMLRNSAPIDAVIGRNWNNRDTIRIQNNRFENNTIRDFGYGVLSIGAGPLFTVGNGRYVEYPNLNNIYSGNVIEDVARGGVVVAYEKGSQIIGNTIRRVNNPSTTFPGAAGISATAGGNSLNNRGYSTDLRIERNVIHTIDAAQGSSSAIAVETAENLFITPANVVYRFPAQGATNMRVWNNSAYDIESARALVAMIALYPEATTRIDFVTTGNRVENNTIYNNVSDQTAETTLTVSNADHIGVLATRSGAMVRNNIINLEDPNAIGIVITAPSVLTTMTSDYNAFDIPNGAVGALANISSQGYALPSPPVATTLNQWRALSGLDMNSVSGDVTREFVSTTPGAEDLHIQPNLMGSIVGNRGQVITDLTQDIDAEPRGASSVAGRYDVGSDEFTGQVRNFDIMAEDIIAPAAYRPLTGQFSDAEYVMSDSSVALRTQVRNVGGQPVTNRRVSLAISYVNPVGGGTMQVYSQTKTNVSVDVAQATTSDFGSFQPRTLRELGLNDPFYGSSPNVSPVYRFTVTSGIDDNVMNNSYTKEVRFWLQRSGREAMVAVENYGGWQGMATAAQISNKLNGDTVIAALTRINWSRADGTGTEDYDLFERDRWPSANLSFAPWSTMIWSQGSETTGLLPEERAALKTMLSGGTTNFRHTLVMAGQDVARLHDVALTSSNGSMADADFVQNYLRTDYISSTNPADYSNRLIKGVVITPGRFEELEPTGYAGDANPRPGLLRTTAGSGVARGSHIYTQQTGAPSDSLAGVASSTAGRNVVYYAFDWRHAGRFDFEPDRSGAWRLLLGALDFSQQFRGVLPIELIAFNAYQSATSAVNIEWTTAMETEIASMSIERASKTSDGIGSFSLVERTSARGTATSGADYRVIDRDVVAGGEYVYRLVTTSLEGERMIERQQTVKLTSATTGGMRLSVAPNPVRDRATVTLAGVTAASTVELYDEAGRLVRDLGAVTSSTTIELDASGLANGSYTVRVRTAGSPGLVERITVTR